MVQKWMSYRVNTMISKISGQIDQSDTKCVRFHVLRWFGSCTACTPMLFMAPSGDLRRHSPRTDVRVWEPGALMGHTNWVIAFSCQDPPLMVRGCIFLTEEKRNPKLLALQEVFFRLWRFTILMRVLKILKSMYERLFLFDRILIQHRMNETQTRPADRIATLLHESNAQIWPWNSRGTTQIPKATHDSNNLWRTWNKSEAATSTVSPHFVSTRTTCPIFADYQHYHLGLLVINPINILLIFNSIPISRYIK